MNTEMADQNIFQGIDMNNLFNNLFDDQIEHPNEHPNETTNEPVQRSNELVQTFHSINIQPSSGTFKSPLDIKMEIISSDQNNDMLSIHYTFDETEPTIMSQKYIGPIQCKQPGKYKIIARVFQNNNPVSCIVMTDYITVEETFVDCVEAFPCNPANKTMLQNVEQSISPSGTKPKSKSATESNATSIQVNIPFNDIKKQMHNTLKVASSNLSICPTQLKRICRHYKVQRWPARRIIAEAKNLRIKPAEFLSKKSVKFEETLSIFISEEESEDFG